MPHRIINLIDNTAMQILEGIVLACIAMVSGAEYVAALFSNSDWERITGPHGVAFLAVTACIVLWVTSLRREKEIAKNEAKRDAAEQILRTEEESRRERRHSETLAMQKENSDKLIGLTAESIKAQIHVTTAIQALSKQLDSRPCGLAELKRQQEQEEKE
jgi:uncharacterized membrane protein YcjF (UPF0283 family)